MDIDALADRLVSAIRSRTGIAALTDDVPDLSADTAYDVQDAVLARLGGTVAAAKLGLTSRAKQRQMNVDEPLYGWLTDAMQIHPGEELDTSLFIQPRVEPEIAFLIDWELGGPGITAAHVLAATAGVVPAIDVLDSRFSGYQFTLTDVTADNASAARFIAGANPVAVDDFDLRLTGCVFTKNGEVVETATGAAVMEHPAAAVAWFVRKLHQRGRVLPAGSLVLAGALTAAVPVAPGDVVSAEFDRLGLVELRCG